MVVGLVRLMVVVSVVTTVRIVRSISMRVVLSSLAVTAIALVELVTVLFLLLWRASVVVTRVRIAVFRVLSVRHRSQGLKQGGNREEKVE